MKLMEGESQCDIRLIICLEMAAEERLLTDYTTSSSHMLHEKTSSCLGLVTNLPSTQTGTNFWNFLPLEYMTCLLHSTKGQLVEVFLLFLLHLH